MPRGGATKLPIESRILATISYFEAGGDKHAAARRFEQNGGRGPVRGLASWIEKWGERFRECGSVLDALRSGRPPAVTADAATLRAAAAEFKAGRSARRQDGFTSIEEAVRERPGLAALLDEKVRCLRCLPQPSFPPRPAAPAAPFSTALAPGCCRTARPAPCCGTCGPSTLICTCGRCTMTRR